MIISRRTEGKTVVWSSVLLAFHEAMLLMEETDESDRKSTRVLVLNNSNMPIYASYGVNLVLCQDLVQVKMRNFSPF